MTLDELRSFVDAAMDHHKARFSCSGAGCNGCCRGSVELTLEEAEDVVEVVDEAGWLRVERAAADLVANPLTARCPLIDPETGGCSVYEKRPLVCRSYASTSPRDWCWPERSGRRTVERLMPTVITELLLDVASSNTSTDLGTALLQALSARRARKAG